jgi:hypothetical protein
MSFRGLILAGAALALAWAALAQDPPVQAPTHLDGMGNPENPADQPKCRSCHRYTEPGPGGTLEEHMFILPIYDQCMQHHHTPKEIGRSHPIGMDPNESDAVVEVPPELPLESSDPIFEEDKTMSCGTCHQPHVDRLSESKASPRDQPVEEADGIRLYRTNYLRMPDPVAGYATLCLSCHQDY